MSYVIPLLMLSLAFARGQEHVYKSQLPIKLQPLATFSATEKDVVEHLGKAGERKQVEKDLIALFYEVSGVKYDTTLMLRKGELESIIYSFPGGDKKLKDFVKYISSEELARAFEQQHETKMTHEAGREFTIKSKDRGFELHVRNDSGKTVSQIVLWKTQGKQP